MTRASGGDVWTENDPLQKAKDDYFFSKDFNKKDYEDTFGHEDLVEQGRRDVRARDAWIKAQNTISEYRDDPSKFADKYGLYNPLQEDRKGIYQRSMEQIHGGEGNRNVNALKTQQEAMMAPYQGMSREAQYARMKRDQVRAKIPYEQRKAEEKARAEQYKTAQLLDNQTKKQLQNQFLQNETQRRDTMRNVMDEYYGKPLEEQADQAFKKQNQAYTDMARLRDHQTRDENGNWHDAPGFWEQAAQVADDATGNVGSSLYNMGKAWSKGDVGGGFMNLLGAGTGLMSLANPAGIALNGANVFTKHAGAPKWLGDVVQTIGSAKNPVQAAVNMGMQYGLPEVLKATGAIPSQKKGGKIPSHHVYGYQKEQTHTKTNIKKTNNRTPYKRKI